HLRGSAVSCRRERQHDATDTGDHRLRCARGLLLLVLIAGALTPFHFVKYRRIGVLLDWLVTLAVLSSLGYAILVGTRFAIDEIARGHVPSRSSAPHSPPGP